MLRPAIGYGVTENFKVSVSAPLGLKAEPLAASRLSAFTSMMVDFEGTAIWRFHGQDTGIGSRVESALIQMEHSIGVAKSCGPLGDYLSLFTSFGTLLCCALASLLVLLGMGATVAGLLSAVPSLVTLSQHKNWVFLISGSMIGGNFLYTYLLAPHLRGRGQPCSVSAHEACTTARTLSRFGALDFRHHLRDRLFQRLFIGSAVNAFR